MAAINVRRDVKDSFYRYKMPRLISKVGPNDLDSLQQQKKKNSVWNYL